MSRQVLIALARGIEALSHLSLKKFRLEMNDSLPWAEEFSYRDEIAQSGIYQSLRIRLLPDGLSSIFATDWQAAELEDGLLRPREMRGSPGERGRIDIGTTIESSQSPSRQESIDELA
jgi:hypothetical protein